MLNRKEGVVQKILQDPYDNDFRRVLITLITGETIEVMDSIGSLQRKDIDEGDEVYLNFLGYPVRKSEK